MIIEYVKAISYYFLLSEKGLHQLLYEVCPEQLLSNSAYVISAAGMHFIAEKNRHFIIAFTFTENVQHYGASPLTYCHPQVDDNYILCTINLAFVLYE